MNSSIGSSGSYSGYTVSHYDSDETPERGGARTLVESSSRSRRAILEAYYAGRMTETRRNPHESSVDKSSRISNVDISSASTSVPLS